MTAQDAKVNGTFTATADLTKMIVGSINSPNPSGISMYGQGLVFTNPSFTTYEDGLYNDFASITYVRLYDEYDTIINDGLSIEGKQVSLSGDTFITMDAPELTLNADVSLNGRYTAQYTATYFGLGGTDSQSMRYVVNGQLVTFDMYIRWDTAPPWTNELQINLPRTPKLTPTFDVMVSGGTIVRSAHLYYSENDNCAFIFMDDPNGTYKTLKYSDIQASTSIRISGSYIRE